MKKESEQIKIESIPKYYQLKEILLNKIMKGKFPPYTKFPSETELIKKYRISNTPVKRALNELVKEGILYAIQGKGRFVSPFRTQKNNDSQQINKLILYIMPNIKVEFYADILRGILEITQKRGYNVEPYNTNNRYTNEKAILNLSLERPLAGLMFVPVNNKGNYSTLFQLNKKRIPIILVDKDLKKYNFDFVGSENIKGAKKIVNYLINLGHKKIAYVGTYQYDSTSIPRLEGYIQALKENRIEIDQKLILSDKVKFELKTDLQYGYEQMKKLLSRNVEFSVVFLNSDYLAIGAYEALKEKNIKVPDDISIAGFGNILLSDRLEVPLTTVSPDGYRIGCIAAKLLIERIEDKIRANAKPSFTVNTKRIFVKTKLIVRESTKEKH